MWSYWPIVEALSSIYDALVKDTPLDYFGARNYVPMYRQPPTYGIRNALCTALILDNIRHKSEETMSMSKKLQS